MKVAIIGCGNVGLSTAADLSRRGHTVDVIKTSLVNSDIYETLQFQQKHLWLYENETFHSATLYSLSNDFTAVRDADVIILTTQANYHREIISQIQDYLSENQILIIVCSYLASSYVQQHCRCTPIVVETTGPYLEGRIERHMMPGEIVFRVGCRLTHTPLSILQEDRKEQCLNILHQLNEGFSCDYTPIESALHNPNMVLHTVGAIMSLPRIEYSDGNFCMYREAYSRKNNSTLNLMLRLDNEKKTVVEALGGKAVDIFKAGGFRGDPMESFYSYSESSDRAISPTSTHSRYILEDVSEGLVLLESIAQHIGVATPIASSLITIASSALGIDFRTNGRTVEKLGLAL